MAHRYSEEEDKKLNAELKKLQTRAKKIILSDYYDHISLSELQYCTLRKITNANSHYDINWNLWMSGLMEKTLDDISQKISNARKEK